MKRIKALLLLLLSVTLLLSLTLPVSAWGWRDQQTTAAETEPQTEPETDEPLLYNCNFDEIAGSYTVDMNFVIAERGVVDLLPVLQEASAKGATVEIDAGRIKVTLSGEAVKRFAESEEPVFFHIEDRTVTAEEESAEEGGALDSASQKNERRYKISMGDTQFEPGTVRVRIRFVPEVAANVRVFAAGEDGSLTELTATCHEKMAGFYPDSFAEFVVTEDIAANSSTPKVLLLAFGALAVTGILSAVLGVLLGTGTLKRLCLKKWK